MDKRNSEWTNVTDQSSFLSIVVNTCIPRHYIKILKLVFSTKVNFILAQKNISSKRQLANLEVYFK